MALHGPSSAFMAQNECTSFRGGKAAPAGQRRGKITELVCCMLHSVTPKWDCLCVLKERDCTTSVYKALNTLNRCKKKNIICIRTQIPFDQFKCVVSIFHQNSSTPHQKPLNNYGVWLRHTNWGCNAELQKHWWSPASSKWHNDHQGRKVSLGSLPCTAPSELGS